MGVSNYYSRLLWCLGVTGQPIPFPDWHLGLAAQTRLCATAWQVELFFCSLKCNELNLHEYRELPKG